MTTPMIPLFQIAPNDQSIGYLSQIFGTVSGVLTNTVNPQAGPINVLSTMFKTFNSVILVVAVLMLVYITIIGVIATAHEGEFMGRKMNNIWIPIRAVMGIALLVPTGAGYCAIQIVMMWVIVQGVGAADVLWNTALGYVSVESPYGSSTVTGLQTTQVLNGVFQGLVCQASQGNAITAFTPQSNCPGGVCTYSLGNCGTLNYCDTGSCSASGSSTPGSSTGNPSNPNSSLACLTCQAQVTALQAIINQVFTPIAQSFATADASYLDFYANSASKQSSPNWRWISNYCSAHNPTIPPDQCCFGNGQTSSFLPCKAPLNNMPPVYDSTNNQQDKSNASLDAVQNLYWKFYPQMAPSLGVGSDFVPIATGQYKDMANAAFTSYMSTQGKNVSTGNGVLSDASKNGWIFAGALYYSIASSNSNDLKGSIPILNWNPPEPSQLKNFRNNYTAASYLSQAASGTSQGPSNPQLKSVTSGLDSVPDTIGSAFSSNVNNKGSNPLVVLQAFGATMLMLAYIIMSVMFEVVVSLASALAAGSITFLGTGDPGLIGWLGPIEIFVIPAFYAGLALLVTIGASLAIYTPLLPFIYFTFGAIAWMIAVIEAMVAGPLVALFIINPKGEHEIMGKAEPALMLLFNIFLRPSLMIFGLMAAMLLATVVLSLINATFSIVLSTNGVAHYDPLSLILVLCAYMSLVLAGLNKCFQVINLIPQQVMSWIGHQAAGVEAPTEAIKGGIEAGAAKGGAAVTATEGGTDRLGKLEKRHQAKKPESGAT